MSSGTLRRIGAAAVEVGVSNVTLRTWEREGLMHVPRDSEGNRLYGDREIALARKIKEQRRAARVRGLRSQQVTAQ